ncbi:transporter, major facilitator family protein [Toxoplasma gondii CAST]|uniref:Transporter, major facilitator family protein n=1 Tax=Toxoplasma gondii CAST TaxID=943122 RepID=A0A3R7YSY7_TOXGO|nr:transporter, major facilitator family protein [Toxoplasma gondii CAST]
MRPRRLSGGREAPESFSGPPEGPATAVSDAPSSVSALTRSTSAPQRADLSRYPSSVARGSKDDGLRERRPREAHTNVRDEPADSKHTWPGSEGADAGAEARGAVCPSPVAAYRKRHSRSSDRGHKTLAGTDGQTKEMAKTRRSFFLSFLDREGEEPLHINVYLMLYFRVVNSISYAARAAAIFDAYLHMRFGGNRAIGTLVSFSGLVTIVVAPLAGVAADRFKSRRCFFLRCSALFGFACIYVNWLAVSGDNFSLFILNTFMWKAWWEFVTVCTEALFNDCIPPGRRSELYVYRRIAATLANGVGPLFSLAVFLLEGNAWSLPVLHSVLHVGLILTVPQMVLLWVWRDVPSGLSECLHLRGKEEQQDFVSEDGGRGREEREAPASRTSPANSTVLQRRQGARRSKEANRQEACRRAAVPWLVFVSHFVTFCGAGMTVKYFPLFFKSEYQFQPTQTCLLSSVYTLFIAFFTYVIQHFAAYLGRPQASLLFTGLGICCLFLLSAFHYLPLVIVFYLFRGALQNASTPIDRSLLMDFIDSKHVGKWSAMQSVATMTWSLSALVGGYIADRVSYRQTFVITGCVYILAELIYLPLLWLVPAHLDSARNRPPAKRKAKSVERLEAEKLEIEVSDGEANCPA